MLWLFVAAVGIGIVLLMALLNLSINEFEKKISSFNSSLRKRYPEHSPTTEESHESPSKH